MSKCFFLFLLLATSASQAAGKLAVDLNLAKIIYKKPLTDGVGPAGSMIFKTANLDNNGIVLNITNINNLFDSQLFVRPTFLGFTTQFGNFGVTIDPKSVLNTIKSMDVDTAKFVLDENQLNFSGKSFIFSDNNSLNRLFNFRIYCQREISTANSQADVAPEIQKNCLNFMTLNGNAEDNKEVASLEYNVTDPALNQKTQFVAAVKSFDFRKNQIMANIPSFQSTSTSAGGVYSINTTGLLFNCTKDEGIQTLDATRLISGCLNDVSANSFKANLNDSKQKTGFDLDFKNLAVKNRVLSTVVNSVAIRDANSSSTINIRNLNLKCRKEIGSNLLEVTNVIRDCISYSEIAIGEVASNNNVTTQDESSNKNIFITTNGGSISVQADVTFLGITKQVTVSGSISFDEKSKKIILAITDTRLPLGINSIKLVMYFLKKSLASKVIQIDNNMITVSL